MPAWACRPWGSMADPTDEYLCQGLAPDSAHTFEGRKAS